MIFQVTQRLGGGAASNVTAGTLTQCALPIVQSVTNPLPATNGVDPETADSVRQVAADAFRAVTYRAVRPEDYAEAVERLDWVQRAGASFRWTGSWLTAFATPDPVGSFTVSAAQRAEALDQLDRFRQAGRPAYLLDPIYANLDLVIVVCVAASAYQGEVEQQVLQALFGVRGIRPRQGFFSPDNFTFGTPLERSRLEAVIQEIPGVRAVEEIAIRRRGWFDWRLFTELTFQVGPDEVIRVENSTLVPERGSLKLEMRGGA
jgi:predicted phage baseplate assembly protein